MTRRGPALAALSAILVFIAMQGNTVPVFGIILYPYFGTMLAAGAWFAYWGVVGAMIGYALPVFIGLPFVVALESVTVTFVGLAAFVGLLRAWWIDTRLRSVASLIGVTKVTLITVLVRQFIGFTLFVLPALNRSNAPTQLLWSVLISLVEMGLTTFVVVLVLLRFAQPVTKACIAEWRRGVA